MEVTAMRIGTNQLAHLETFVMREWIQRGCERIDRLISQMIRDGFLDSRVENECHPIHQLWYSYVLGKNLPHDFLMTRADALNIQLRRLHRMLTLEQLIVKLAPTWDRSLANNVRGKFRNPPEFESVLFEMIVALSFREAGHSVNLRIPQPPLLADITGVVADTPIDIECKRITVKSKPHADRLAALNKLGKEILGRVSRWSESTYVDIQLGESTSLDAVREVFQNLGALPSWKRRAYLPGPWTVMIEAATGPVQFVGELEPYDVVVADGVSKLGDPGQEKLSIVRVKDHSPTDWAKATRESLQDARRQLDASKCNLVCLQVADMPNFESTAEVRSIISGIEAFLKHDTRRVSAVMLINIGVISEESEDVVLTFRTIAQTWLSRNPDPYIPLPNGFIPPSFCKPLVTVRASIEKQSK